MNYKEDLILVHEEVPAGETVWNGFIGGQTTCTAPKEEVEPITTTLNGYGSRFEKKWLVRNSRALTFRTLIWVYNET